MKLNGQLIKELVTKHQPVEARMNLLFARYKNDIVPIQKKTVATTTNINNQIINPYHKLIVDQVVGYMFGNPIKYALDESGYNETEHQVGNATLKKFLLRNHMNDLMAEIGKQASIMGYGAGLLYIDRQGRERMMKTHPARCVFHYDSNDELALALRYYDIQTTDKHGRPVTRKKVEAYNQTTITYFIEDDEGNFVFDMNEGQNPKRHQFKTIPLKEFPNNEERKGDFEMVISQIDALDNLLSNAQDEIEQFRNAYLALYGGTLTDDDLKRLKQTGLFELDDEQRVEFITKQINDVLIENQKKTLNDNIFRFSSAVDMNDEKFAGNQSGIALKYKLMALENKSIVKERKFTKALTTVFETLATFWAVREIPIDYLDIQVTFSRNIPIDLVYQAEVATKLKGVVSEDTRLSQLDIVKDVKEEKEKMKDDMESDMKNMIDLENMNLLDEGEQDGDE